MLTELDILYNDLFEMCFKMTNHVMQQSAVRHHVHLHVLYTHDGMVVFLFIPS